MCVLAIAHGGKGAGNLRYVTSTCESVACSGMIVLGGRISATRNGRTTWIIVSRVVCAEQNMPPVPAL